MQHGHQEPYGDDRVHFDPVRAVQSIKLSADHRTARSNDNFLSTVILNTYFFNNTVVHHDEIKQNPPKFPYENYQSSDEEESGTSDSDDDASSSSYESTSDEESDSEEEDDSKYSNNSPPKPEDMISPPIKTKISGHHPSASQNNIIHTKNGNYILHNHQVNS